VKTISIDNISNVYFNRLFSGAQIKMHIRVLWVYEVRYSFNDTVLHKRVEGRRGKGVERGEREREREREREHEVCIR
jgi:hypothetical protein